MTTNQPTSSQYRNSVIAIALVVLFAIAAFFLTRPQTGSGSVSSVSGLMSLKASAQSAMPYNVAMGNQKPTLIEFYADWCTTCQGLAPTLVAAHDEFSPAVNFVMLDIDDPQWRSQVQEFHVSGVPHLFLLDENHTVTDTFVGNVPKSVLRDRISSLINPTASLS